MRVFSKLKEWWLNRRSPPPPYDPGATYKCPACDHVGMWVTENDYYPVGGYQSLHCKKCRWEVTDGPAIVGIQIDAYFARRGR